MVHLIDKSAVVAEIKRRINEINLDTIEDWRYRLQREHDIEIMKNILSLIDTLEVKEVDLEKYYHDFLQKEWFDKTCNRTMSEMMAFTAEHFFELGLKVAQKGEEV